MTSTAPIPQTVLPESTWTAPRPDCPHPQRWHATDDDSTEIEVSALVAAFVTALRPDIVVETGTAWGQTAEAIGKALLGTSGHLTSFEVDPDRVWFSRRRCEGLPVDVVESPSLLGISQIHGPVGFAWLDSLFDLRFAELAALVRVSTDRTVVGMHDTGPHHPLRAKLHQITGWNRIDLPTPRGVSFFSRGA